MPNVNRMGAEDRLDWHLAQELDGKFDFGTPFGTLGECDTRDMQLAVEQSEWFKRARHDAFDEGVSAARGRDVYSVITNPYVPTPSDARPTDG